MANEERERSVAPLLGDGELEQYVTTLTSSSNRVRYVVLVIAVTSILLFVGYRNSRSDSWHESRLELAHLALEHDLWASDSAADGSAEELKSPVQQKRESARKWVKGRQFKSEKEVRRWLEQLETLEVNSILNLTMPFLGLRFDVNDLGVFGGLGFSILMIVLVFSVSREHENLFLSLWKVRRVCKAEDGYDYGESQANLLYHALAMGQVFGKPPSLARWKPRFSRHLVKILFAAPIVVQAMILDNDLKMHEFALIINPTQTKLNIAIQVGALLFITVFAMMSCLYARASNLRWKETFLHINPSFKDKDQPSWPQWVKLKKRSETQPEDS